MSTYNTLLTLTGAALTEFLMGRVNRSELLVLEGMAEFDDRPELAYAIWEVRTA